MDTQVLIIGAGPTGLTLAIDLGLRGISCTIIEQKEAPQFLPKMERCNARSMEIYRRMGIVEKVRAAGLPARCPMDVFIVLSLVEPPLLHLPYPSVEQARQEIAACNDGTLPLEPYQLISQYTLEPLLKSIAERLPPVSVRYGCEFLDFEEDAASVTANVRSSAGATSQIRARYLVGCDGGSSVVRKQLGIALRGEGNILQLRQALYRCDELFERIPIGKGRHYHVADDRATQLIMQDSTRHFTLHSVVEQDSDMHGQFAKTIAMPLDFEMLYVRRMEAEPAARGRLRPRPRVPRGRCRASDDPDGRARHEQRRGRRRRSLVEARRRARTDGAGRHCCPPMRSNAARSARTMSRPRATPHSEGGNGAPPGSRTFGTPRPRAARPAQTLRASPMSSSARPTR